MDDKTTQKLLKDLSDQVIQTKIPGFMLIDTINILRTSLQSNARAISFYNSVLDRSLELLSNSTEQKTTSKEDLEKVEKDHDEHIKEKISELEKATEEKTLEE